MFTYIEFADVIYIPFYLMCNCSFRGSAMLCLETIQFFRHALHCHLQGEFEAGGVAVRVKVGWSVVMSYEKAT
jgi:hypothetical protein